MFNKSFRLRTVLLGLTVLAASCSSSSAVEANASTGEAEETEQESTVQDLFEATAWRIVGQEGLSIDSDGLVAFEQFEADDILSLTVLPCGRWYGRPIAWNEEGFALTVSANPTGGYDTLDFGCGTEAGLHEFITGGVGSEQFVTSISEDGTTAQIRRGELMLELVPTTVPTTTTTIASPVTEAVATTTTTQAVEG